MHGKAESTWLKDRTEGSCLTCHIDSRGTDRKGPGEKIVLKCKFPVTYFPQPPQPALRISLLDRCIDDVRDLASQSPVPRPSPGNQVLPHEFLWDIFYIKTITKT